MSKDKHLDEIQLCKLFKEAFGNEAEIYNNVYYPTNNKVREIDIIIKCGNINFLVGLNGKDKGRLKDAYRSAKHNVDQLTNFLIESYSNGAEFYVNMADGSKEYHSLTKAGIYLLISCSYAKGEAGSINSFENVCNKQYVDTGICIMNISYNCIYFLLRDCIYFNVRFRGFAMYLMASASRRANMVLNCNLAIEFGLTLLKDSIRKSSILFVSKRLDTILLDTDGLFPLGIDFFKLTCRSDDPIFTDRVIPCTVSRYLMRICEDIEERTDLLSEYDMKKVRELAESAREGHAYCFLKHKGQVYSIYDDAMLYVTDHISGKS